MAIYRSQKTAWEDSLRTHAKPILVTNSTATLAAIDLDSISLTGVRPSANPRPKTLGLAATLRNARAEAELEATVEMGDEEAEERTRKKAKKEEDDGLMLGFDYAKPIVVVPVPKVRKEVTKKKVEGAVKVAKKYESKSVRTLRGDEKKRPKSAEGWWDDG